MLLAALLLSYGATVHPAVASAFPGTGADTAELVRDARARLANKDWDGAARLLETHLKHARGDGATHDTLALALEKLGRLDEAAQHFDDAAQLYQREAKDGPARGALSSLRRVDPLSVRRDAFLRKVFADLYDAAGELASQGHTQRALDLFERLQPLARGKDEGKLGASIEKARAAFVQVDLDEKTRARPEGGWPLVERESKHYRFACNLEPELVERLGDLMDDLHGYYVQVYFDGEAKRARGEKATIKILPNKKEMLALWQGGDPPEGWWSPATNEVITFDTRTQDGSLDEMLLTLFHEASHQFMTLASGGGYVPAWINEGTATFFEGARAMADRRVLWPDAAAGRLASLAAQLRGGKAPTALDVVAYASMSSYPAEYYSYGWGLVYFLQEYEDARTLEHVYRPLYARYKSEIVKRGGDPLGLFGEVFLGPSSPLGHTRFVQFEADWRAWILEQVFPLFGTSKDVRARRLARVERYLAAADAAHEQHKVAVSEDELLARALRDIEYVVGTIDGDEHPDGAWIVRQSEVLERLARPAAAAPLLERALDLADQKLFVVDEARYAELEKRLAKLDRRNAALRNARSRMSGLARSARTLLTDYRASPSCGVLRAYTLAAQAGAALDDGPGLLAAARELRDQARAAGLLSGTILAVDAPKERWSTILSSPATEFAVGPGGVTLESVRAMAFVDPDLNLSGEYELRVRLVRESKADFGAAWGAVVAARPAGNWTVVGIDERGSLGVWVLTQSAKKAVTTSRTLTLPLDPPVGEDEQPELALRVLADGRLSMRVGERAALETRLDLDPSLPRNVGVFAKNGRVRLEGFVVEQVP